MAEITIKIVSTGEVIPISDINLELVTGEELIQELVAYEIIRPESELPPKRCDGSHGYYGIVNMQGQKLNSSEEPCKIPLSELGFKDGDTIRIVAVGCCA